MVSYTEVLAVTLEKYKEVFMNSSQQVFHTTFCVQQQLISINYKIL